MTNDVNSILIKDKSLNAKSVLLVMFFINKGPGYKPVFKHLLNQFRGIIGKDKLYLSISQCIEKGYLERAYIDVDGKRIVQYWVCYDFDNNKFTSIKS